MWEHSGCVYRQIISLIQYSWNWAFLYNDSSAIGWLHYDFLRSMVAKCESNENGRFLAQLGLAKLRLNRRCCFLGKTKLFHGKITACLHSILLGTSYMQRRANFLSFPKKFDFVWFLWTFALNSSETYNSCKTDNSSETFNSSETYNSS